MTQMEIALGLCREVSHEDPSGCCLHIVIEDGNLDDHFLGVCLSDAKDRKCWRCVLAAQALLMLTDEERTKVFEAI